MVHPVVTKSAAGVSGEFQHFKVVFLRKLNGKPRPVSLCEILPKLAMATALCSQKPNLLEVFATNPAELDNFIGPDGTKVIYRQFGAGEPSGVERMTSTAYALMQDSLHLAFIALDTKNAFNSIAPGVPRVLANHRERAEESSSRCSRKGHGG